MMYIKMQIEVAYKHLNMKMLRNQRQLGPLPVSFLSSFDLFSSHVCSHYSVCLNPLPYSLGAYLKSSFLFS